MADRFGLDDEGEDRFGLDEPEGQVDPWDVVRRMPQFQELMKAQELAQRATTDPSVGDRNRFLDRIQDLTAELEVRTGVPRDALQEFVRQEIGGEAARYDPTGQNVLGAVTGILEPLAFPGDVLRTFGASLADVQGERVAREAGLGGGARDIDPRTGTFAGEPASTPWQAASEMGQAALRTAGQLGFGEPPVRLDDEGSFRLNPESGWIVYAPSVTWDRFRWGVSPYEADLRVTGADFDRRFGISERLGIEDETQKAWVGLGIEVLTDPLLWADWMFLGAKIGRGAARVSGSERLAVGAERLEEASRKAYRVLTPVGAADVVKDVARPFGITDLIGNAVTSGINRVLDVEMSTRFLRPEQRLAHGTMGFGASEVLRPKLRDLLFQGGRVEGIRGGPAAWLTGSTDTGLSIGEQAMGMERVIQSIGLRGAREVAEALTDGLRERRMFRMPWMRTAIPNAEVVPTRLQGYVRGLSSVVSDFVDTVGITRAANRLEDLPTNFRERLSAVSRQYDIPDADTFNRFIHAAQAARRTTLQVGYETSGYRDFTRAMRQASEELGIDYGDARRAYEDMVGGIDLQTLERQDFFTTVVPGSTGATPATPAALDRAREIRQAWEGSPEALQMWEQAVQGQLRSMGRADLAAIDPATYLKGMREGYLRRMFEGVDAPLDTARALQNREIITVRSVDPEDMASQFTEALGEDRIGQVVQDFFRGREVAVPRGLTAEQAGSQALNFRTDDLANLLSTKLGREVSVDEVARIIYRDSDNASFLQETIDTLHRLARSEGGSGSGGAPFGMTPRPFESRVDFDIEDLARRVLLRDPVTQTAEVGLRGGRQVRAQEFLRDAFDNLQRDGMIRRADDIPAPGEGLGEWIILPDKPKVWGPLAGQGVPKDAARMMVHTINTGGRTQRGTFDRVLSMWRQGLLAPLSTSMRNVVGNFILIQQAGGDLSDMITRLPAANRLRNSFIETGRLPQEFRGYEHLFSFLRDSTRTSTAVRGLDELLERVARGKTGLETVLDRAESFVEWGTRTPAVGGFLEWFRYGEEISRTTAFLSTYSRLTRGGMKAEEAIQRASHFAVNSAYNYGATPLLPEILRRSGLSAFPQFTWFTVSRTARMLTENPAAAARIEHLRKSFNLEATEGDLMEQERITQMMADWQRATQPAVIPVPGKDGEYYAFDLQYWMPQGANILDLVADPLTAGVFAPVIDAFMAHRTGEGVGPFGARFGQRVFQPGDEAPQQALQTGAFLAQQFFLPGAMRVGRQIGEAVRYNDNKDLFDQWGLAAGRYYDSDWAQLAGRLVGLNSRRVSVKADGVSFRQRYQQIERNFNTKIQDVRRRLEERAFTNNADYYALQERLVNLEIQKAEALERLTKFIR